MDDQKLPLIEHLKDLRRSLRNSSIALLLSMVVALWWSQELYVLLARPLVVAWSNANLGVAEMNFGSLTEPFWTYFSLSLWAGIFLSSPVIFHQLWKFIAPGLYEKEKRVAVPFAACSAICFIGGAAFCYAFVLPAAFKFFLSYANENAAHMRAAFGFLDTELSGPLAVKPTLFMQQYLDLVLRFLVAFGLIFELPLLIFFLSYVGLVTHRKLWRFNKYAIVLSFVIGALLTPGPDVVSQLLMAIPLVVLYNISIVVALLVTRKREARQKAEAEAQAQEPPPEDGE
jgi:sec-independent protein translocase protein TatC